eukprot:TRINITY_DN3769_c0_g1_i3.p1 TRINITY_DN3769_c0_g1~~TRINITY_DN3769_c0_g1_i3.p1  ORF type:complete len:417 (-),score=72.93 TRINITY_DN3769_c0_g1_i3:26-1276(-)
MCIRDSINAEYGGDRNTTMQLTHRLAAWLLVAPVRIAGPASVLLTLLRLLSASKISLHSSIYRRLKRWRGSKLWFLVYVEATFWILSLLRMQRLRQPPPMWTHDSVKFPYNRRREYWGRIIRDELIPGRRAWLCDWLFQADYNEIGVENVREWLAWVWFNSKSYEVLGERERLEVDTDLGTIQEHLGGLQPGYNHKVESMRLNIDDPCKLSNGNAQPLALYGVLGGLGALSSSLMMWTLGFTRSTQRRVTYWVHRPAEGAPSEGEPPVMFIHGIGIGLLPYRPWLVHLCGQGRTVLVLEVGTVNYSLQDPRSPACQEWVSTLAEVLLALGEVKMDLMAHSYGSVLATWLINSRPEVIRHTLLVDPITVLLQRSDVCRRFLYRPPNKSVKDRIMSTCLLYTSPSPRDRTRSRMPSSA